MMYVLSHWIVSLTILQMARGERWVTESALIRSRLRAPWEKIFAKMDYGKTIGPEPASSGSYS